MNEQRKRIPWYLLLAAALLLLSLPVTPLSVKADEEMTAVLANVPADWKDPCVWAWAEDGTAAFAAWPGDAMEALPDNDGWYYLYVPVWADHVIINANAGEVQTEEQLLSGGPAWITVTDAETITVSEEPQTTGDIPEYVETFLVHAKVDESWDAPCLWAWSAPDGTNAYDAWPGKAMRETDSGWYEVKAPVFVNSIIVNGNGGDIQTEDISIDAAELWVTVDADGGYELSYIDPDKAAVEDITVYVSAPADWDAPHLWAWSAPDGTNVYANWPGEELTSDGSWLTLSVPGWVNSLIVNGNDGSIQTADISVDAGKDVWIVVSGSDDAYEVYYEEPTLAEAETEAAAEEASDTSETANEAENDEAVAEKSGVSGGVVAGGIAAVAAVAAIGGGVYAKRKKG